MHGPLSVKYLKPAAAKSVPTYRAEQVMLEMVHDRTATDVTSLVGMAAVLRYGKQMDRVKRCYFSWIACFQKQRRI
jgi:hypothetical protein